MGGHGARRRRVRAGGSAARELRGRHRGREIGRGHGLARRSPRRARHALRPPGEAEKRRAALTAAAGPKATGAETPPEELRGGLIGRPEGRPRPERVLKEAGAPPSFRTDHAAEAGLQPVRSPVATPERPLSTSRRVQRTVSGVLRGESKAILVGEWAVQDSNL